jgi:hypothetical protein
MMGVIFPCSHKRSGLEEEEAMTILSLLPRQKNDYFVITAKTSTISKEDFLIIIVMIESTITYY